MHPWKDKSWPERKACAEEFRQWFWRNPESRLKAGVIREDGLVFAAYNVNHKDGEKWITLEAREKAILRMREWAAENRESRLIKQRNRYQNDAEFNARHRANSRKWRMANAEKSRAQTRAWHIKHPERSNELKRKWMENNRESIRERGRNYGKRFPEKKNAATARRWAAKKRQLHPEHDNAVEIAMRAEAKRLKAETGITHHVDHIIPLKHGGWHHHLNLQVLPSDLNLRKNRDPFWHHPGFKSWRDVPEYLWPDDLAPQYRAELLRAA